MNITGKTAIYLTAREIDLLSFFLEGEIDSITGDLKINGQTIPGDQKKSLRELRGRYRSINLKLLTAHKVLTGSYPALGRGEITFPTRTDGAPA